MDRFRWITQHVQSNHYKISLRQTELCHKDRAFFLIRHVKAVVLTSLSIGTLTYVFLNHVETVLMELRCFHRSTFYTALLIDMSSPRELRVRDFSAVLNHFQIRRRWKIGAPC